MESRKQQQVVKPLAVDFSRAGVCVLESHHAQGFHMPWTSHSFYNLLHIIGGRGRLEWEQGEWQLRPGDFVFTGVGVPHRIIDESGNPLSLYAICVRRRVLQGYAPSEPMVHSGKWSRNQELRRIVREMLIEQGSSHAEEEAMLHSLSVELVVRVMRSADRGEDARENRESGAAESRGRVEAYIRELNSRFFEEESLDEAARRIGVSRRSLTSYFREITGESRQSWIRRLRIEHACRLLAETDRSIEGVAFECGFNDLSHFYRCFKAETGKSPRRYRGM